MPPSTGLGSTALSMTLAMLLILFVIFLAYWMLKRFGPRMGLGPRAGVHGLRFEGQLALGPKRSVMVVRFLNKLLVLGVTDQSINLLTEVDDPHEAQEFASALDKARSGLDGPPGGDPAAGGPGPGGADSA